MTIASNRARFAARYEQDKKRAAEKRQERTARRKKRPFALAKLDRQDQDR